MLEPLTGEERQLLATYTNGPKIWDAAGLKPAVDRLYELGLIAHLGRAVHYDEATANLRFAITATGRAALEIS